MNHPAIPAGDARDTLVVVLKVIDIPLPATVGDGEISDAILLERVGHVRIMLAAVLGQERPDAGWQAGYLRDRLAGHPATGYKTWDDVRAGLAAETGAAR